MVTPADVAVIVVDHLDGTAHRPPRAPGAGLTRTACGLTLAAATIGPRRVLIERARQLCTACWDPPASV